MLKSLALKNLATISDTSLEFQDGLNVLTGETGSGKSILIDGLMLATGRRADRSMVRPGTRNAFVEAVFVDPSGEETVIRREISLQGKSRVFVDDSMATLDDVRDSVSRFVELHSQRTTPGLLKPSVQLALLDRFAGTGALRDSYSEGYHRLKDLRAEEASILQFLASAGGTREILLHERSLFRELKPSEDEYRNLITREREIRSAAEHAVLFSRVSEALTGDTGVLSILGELCRRVRRESPDSEGIAELLEQALIAAEEASSMVYGEMEAAEEAPGLIAEIEDRLEGYSRMISRFGGSIGSLLEARDSLDHRLREYDDAMERLERTRDASAKLSGELLAMAGELTWRRSEAAVPLAEAALAEMRKLNLPWADISVNVAKIGEGIEVEETLLGPSGADRAAFLFTANKGVPPGPLDSIASAGELSRVALALALALAGKGEATTLIFDEIDSGTGGETAHSLADSLLRASADRQIIVISHLAQIASRAHRHMAVEKVSGDGMPVTTVRHLVSAEDRAGELARLLGGGDGAVHHARRLLENEQ
ncbi:MAG TPA: AAA family ATPase [Candidatus Sabulitectum sp.]|nr:AAA family ATPase [Candidatus Sabulitectum sp.]